MSRLIDADEFAARMHKHVAGFDQDSREWLISVADVQRILLEVPTVEPNLGWISVKDRLPKSMANEVLVWLKHKALVGYIGLGHYEKYNGQEIWFDLEHGEAFSIRGYTVTHWMPLPEPPKMERSENND